MKKIHHQHIVGLVEVILPEGKPKIYLIIEYMQQGSLMSQHYIQEQIKRKYCNLLDSVQIQSKTKNFRLSDQLILKYWRQLLLALDYLHNYVHVVHRDIKPDNLLVDELDNLKIADFGVSNLIENQSTVTGSKIGTPAFYSPEIFTNPDNIDPYPIDVWAAGVTLFYLLFLKMPFEGSNYKQLEN